MQSIPGTNYSWKVGVVSSCASDQVCIAPWGCLSAKNVPSNVGFGIGLGSPYQVDIFQLCSPSNPLASGVFPCNVLNAGTIVSVALAASAILILVGLFLFIGIGKHPKLPFDGKRDWVNRLSKITEKVEYGCQIFAKSCMMTLMFSGLFFFVVLLITFTLRQRVDLTDGIRIAGVFLLAVISAILVLSVSLRMLPGFISSFVHAVEKVGVREGLHTGFLASRAVAFLTIGTALFGLCVSFLFLTVDRNDPSAAAYPTLASSGLASSGGFDYFAYGNRCRTPGNGAFCSHVLSLQSVCGYALGLSFVALVYRSVCGVFAKAAEVGDELVDKLERTTIDQQHNPALGADLVGGLAVEVLGQGADLMESLVLSVVACAFLAQGDGIRLALPFWFAGFGLAASLVGLLFVACRDDFTSFDGRYVTVNLACKAGLYATSILALALDAVAVGILFPADFPNAGSAGLNSVMGQLLGSNTGGWRFFAIAAIGIGAGLLHWECTAYFTSHRYSPTQSVAASGVTGIATHLIQGFGVAMFSCLPTLVLLAVDIIGCHAIADQYGVALSAVAMASPMAFAAAVGALGPIMYAASAVVCGTDAAQALKERLAPMDMAGMANLAEVRGWSAALAAKAALAVLMAFKDESGSQRNEDAFRYLDGQTVYGAVSGIDAVNATMNRGGIEGDVIGEGIVFGAAVVGAFLPLLCAGVGVLAVGLATRGVVDDARAQMRGGTHEVGRAIGAGLGPAQMGAAIPVLWALAVPAFVGFLIGPRVLVGLLAGGIFGATLLAVMSVNAGSIWAKCEASIAYEGLLGGADSDAHRASWVGTRLGGVLRDVVGPTALATMKTMAMTALLIAPLIFVDKDTGLSTLDNLARRPPANERQLLSCSISTTWWQDGYASGFYFRQCVQDRTVSGVGSVLSCFDWNKAYWGALPGVLLVAGTLFVFFRFWRATVPPLLLPEAPVTLMLQPMIGGTAQYTMRGPKPELIPIQMTQMIPMQVQSPATIQQPIFMPTGMMGSPGGFIPQQPMTMQQPMHMTMQQPVMMLPQGQPFVQGLPQQQQQQQQHMYSL